MMRQKGLCLCVSLALLVSFVVVISPQTSGSVIFSTNLRVNTVTAYDQMNASMAVGPNGTIHIVWEDYQIGQGSRVSAIYYANSTDGGKHFAAGVPVLSPLPTNAWQKFPSITVSSNNWIHVVWTDLTWVGTPTGARVYYARLKPGEPSFETPVIVSDVSMDIGAIFVVPRIAANGTGTCSLHVIWSTYDISKVVNPVFLTYDHSANCGNTFNTDLLVDPTGFDASLDIASDGAVGVAYAANSVPNVANIFFKIMVSALWQPRVQVNYPSATNPLKYDKDPTVAFGPSALPGLHVVHVAWADGRNIDPNDNRTFWNWDIFYSKSGNGVTFGSNLKVNNATPLNPFSEQSEPWIGISSMGNPRISWTDWSNDVDGHRTPIGPQDADVYYGESTNGGASFTKNQRVNDDSLGNGYENSRPSLRVVGSTTFIAWQDGRFPANGLDVYFTGEGLPTLDWCGTPGYTSDGVNPDSGGINTTFVYCILYRSPVGDAPAAGNPRLTILRNGVPIVNGVAMNNSSWVGSVGNYRTGRLYNYTTFLDTGCAAANFSYAFDATDIMGRAVSVFPASTGPVFLSRFSSVDIQGLASGGDHLVAVGWDKCVSLFSALYGQNGPYRAEEVGYVVDYVRLSQDGQYLAVLGNDRPFTNDSAAHLRLYGRITNASAPWPLLYQYNFINSSFAAGRPFDMARDGSFVAVGTGVVGWPPIQPFGSIYLLTTPTSSGPPHPSTYVWGEVVTSLRFSGSASNATSGSSTSRLVATSVCDIDDTVVRMFNLTNGNLGLVWQFHPNYSIESFSVAIDRNATHVGVGHGWANEINFFNGSNGDLQWIGRDLGTTESLALTDDAEYLAVASRRDGSAGNQSFTLWNTTQNPFLPSPRWSFSQDPNSTAPVHISLAVSTPAQYIAACTAAHAYFWTSAAGPAGLGDQHNETLNSDCVDIVITFAGGDSALLERDGVLQVYSVSASGDSLRWERLVP